MVQICRFGQCFRYLHDWGEGLPLASCLQSPVRGDQIQKLDLVAAAAAELQEEPLEDALGLVADGATQQPQAGRRLLSHLPQQLTAAKKRTENNMTSWLQLQGGSASRE